MRFCKLFQGMTYTFGVFIIQQDKMSANSVASEIPLPMSLTRSKTYSGSFSPTQALNMKSRQIILHYFRYI